jgi:hypothetical protein
MKVDLRLMTTKLDVSGMCGSLLWQRLGFVVGSCFGSFSSWIQGTWGNLLSCDLYFSCDTCNIKVYLGFGIYLGLDLCICL